MKIVFRRIVGKLMRKITSNNATGKKLLKMKNEDT
jgi:hypothetical protein